MRIISLFLYLASLRGSRPPGLRGKEIGLWYARRGKMKREHANVSNTSTHICQCK